MTTETISKFCIRVLVAMAIVSTAAVLAVAFITWATVQLAIYVYNDLTTEEFRDDVAFRVETVKTNGVNAVVQTVLDVVEAPVNALIALPSKLTLSNLLTVVDFALDVYAVAADVAAGIYRVALAASDASTDAIRFVVAI